MAVSPAPPGATHRPVAVLGNVTIDLVLRRVPALPEWGEELEAGAHDILQGGQGYLLARALSRLGVPVRVHTVVGDDDWGREMVAQLGSAGVDVTDVTRVRGRRTSLTIALVRGDGERAFVSDFGALQALDDAWAARPGIAAGSAVLCLVGLFNLPALSMAAASRLLEDARRQGLITLLDTGWDPGQWAPETIKYLRDLLRHVDIFIPNEAEAAALSGGASYQGAAAAFLDDGAGLVVVKRGPDGAYARGAGVEASVDAVPVEVVDTVGAGDVFDAGFLYAHQDGRPLPDALHFAAATAGSYVARATSRFPGRDEVEATLATLRSGSPLPAMAHRT